MESSPIRWGILGAARIAKKNWLAILNSGNGIVTAVASRDVARSQSFIDECQLSAPFAEKPRALGSYEELLAAADVDAVYIPLPTGIRREWVLRAAGAGKHIVCEKPCATSVAELREMLETCRVRRVQFMDGVMFMHGNRLHEIRKVLDAKEKIGNIKRINSQFTFLFQSEQMNKDIRLQSRLEPAGCVGDLGWYSIRFTLFAMGWQMPKQVTGRVLSAHHSTGSLESVPCEFSGELLFDGNISAGFYCSFLTDFQQTAMISGTTGQLFLDDFVRPWSGPQSLFYTSRVDWGEKAGRSNMQRQIETHAVSECTDGVETAQETYLFRKFANQVRSRSLNEDWPMYALKTQEVLDACLKSARAGGKVVAIAPVE